MRERVYYFVERLLTPTGWIGPVHVEVSERGRVDAILSVLDAEIPAGQVIRLDGIGIPGMPNLHSHAFQRALVGQTEYRFGNDSFWSWRESMYQLANAIDPQIQKDIASWLYIEMMEAGYTGVGEFHYVHRVGADDGGPLEMALALHEASAEVGLHMVLLPVLYRRGGFGTDVVERQRPFVFQEVDTFLDLVRQLDQHRVSIGFAPHSLRAVEPEILADTVDGFREDFPGRPIHIHIAEQREEVAACLEAFGSRPVQWLMDHHEVDECWCLVHATHLDDNEISLVAGSAAVVGLCPTTEANLGDGIAPALGLATQGGRFGIGSDSHAIVDACEELRALEGSQRLVHERRNLMCTEGSPNVGRYLWSQAVAGGRQALGLVGAGIQVGGTFDLVTLNTDHPHFANCVDDQILDAWIMGGAKSAINDVFVAGRHLVREGRHIFRDEMLSRFRDAMLAVRSNTK